MSFYIGVHGLIVNQQNQVLITKRSATNNYMPLLWDIPGGALEMGETAVETLIREIKEETNLDVCPMEPIYVHSDLSWVPDVQIIQIVYRCKYDKGDIILNPEEHDEYQWVNYKDIDKFDCIAFLKNLRLNYTI